MPASPVVVSSNISKVKVDGEIISGLQEVNLKIEDGQVQGSLKVRNTYNDFDSVIVGGTEKQKSFLITLELTKDRKTFQTFAFPKCYLKNYQLTLDANGLIISEYSFKGSVSNGKKSTAVRPKVGTSTIRPHRIIR